MSLINEALKKAQRQRTEESAEAAPVPGGGRIAKRGQARSANTILLLGVGALVLVVLSVAATVYLVNRPTPPTAEPKTASSAATKSAVPEPSASPITPVTITLPSASPISARETSLAEKAPVAAEPPKISPVTGAGAPRDLAAPNAAPIQSTPAANPAIAAVSPRGDLAAPPIVAPPESPAVEMAKPDERLYQYVDALRITGVKAAGADSRVLMNDRVYRLNDLVERTLGLRLVKVETSTLTFSDANGAIYVKNF